MEHNIDTAMILAAGKGTRMRHLSEERPKPMTPIAGRSLIDRAIDRCVDAGLKRAVVNTFYMADMLEEHLSARDDIEVVISREETLLDTAGGTANALALLGDAPFFAINSDALWLDGKSCALTRMASRYDPARMDHFLMMYPTQKLPRRSPGDFYIEAEPDSTHVIGNDRMGYLRRRQEWEIAPYIYAGIQLTHPGAMKDVPPEEPVSFNILWNAAAGRQSLYGMVHDGLWFHVGTPEAMAETDKIFTDNNL